MRLRQERLGEAEEKLYQEARFQHGWREEDMESCKKLATKLSDVEARLMAEDKEQRYLDSAQPVKETS